MGTEIALGIGIAFFCWGFYERYESRYMQERAGSKNFEPNLFITMGAINVFAAIYSWFV
jgi:hypothetical protein